jgi:hypothetical protein
MFKSPLHKVFYISVLCLNSLVYAQTDSIKSHQSIDDSAEVVIPKQVLADVSMITPPEGFVVSDRFNGYIHYQAGAAIIMSMLENTNFINIEKGMTEDFFRSNQLVLIEKRNFEADNGTKGLIYKSTFVLSGKDYVRYFVYAGDLNRTLWLAITYPKAVETLVDSEILKSIQSINLKPVSNEHK